MRKKIVAGNWKMNLSAEDAISLVEEINLAIQNNVTCEVIVLPPAIWIGKLSEYSKKTILKIGAQNSDSQNQGAFTGEISAKMLAEIGTTHCLVGHSERRAIFKETHLQLLDKIYRLLENNIVPIYCIGETIEQRDKNQHFSTIEVQLSEVIFQLKPEQLKFIVIAYEPVWAIGTGRTATKEQAQEIHQFIRERIHHKFGSEISQSICILYGGSCNPSNAVELFQQKDIDGGLIGGASLKAKDFMAIIDAAN